MKSPKAIIRTVSVAMAMILAATTVRAGDIVDTAISAGSFKTLVAAVKAADLVGTLKSKGPFTVFAPYRCGICQVAGWNARFFAQARKQSEVSGDPYLPRSARQSDGERYCWQVPESCVGARQQDIGRSP